MILQLGLIVITSLLWQEEPALLTAYLFIYWLYFIEPVWHKCQLLFHQMSPLCADQGLDMDGARGPMLA